MTEYKVFSSDNENDDDYAECIAALCFNCNKYNCEHPHIHIKWFEDDGTTPVDGFCSEVCAMEAIAKKAGTSEMAL